MHPSLPRFLAVAFLLTASTAASASNCNLTFTLTNLSGRDNLATPIASAVDRDTRIATQYPVGNVWPRAYVFGKAQRGTHQVLRIEAAHEGALAESIQPIRVEGDLCAQEFVASRHMTAYKNSVAERGVLDTHTGLPKHYPTLTLTCALLAPAHARGLVDAQVAATCGYTDATRSACDVLTPDVRFILPGNGWAAWRMVCGGERPNDARRLTADCTDELRSGAPSVTGIPSALDLIERCALVEPDLPLSHRFRRGLILDKQDRANRAAMKAFHARTGETP